MTMKEALKSWISLFLVVGGVITSLTTHAASSDYKIQAEDILKVTVFDEPSLTRETRVHGSGTIVYPLLESVQVAGMTAREVGDKIRNLLAADFLVNPQVQVDILEYSAQTYSVMGEVRLPSTYKLPAERSIDIVEAISQAGGVTPNGKKNSIELYRDGKRTKYDLDDLLLQKQRNKDPKKLILIKAGDVINIPERFF